MAVIDFQTQKSVGRPKAHISKGAIQSLQARCAAMAGGTVPGVLLAQIVFWHRPSKKTGKPRVRVVKKGHLWIAKTRDEWMYETGLTFKEYKRARSILESKGLIEVQQMPFGALNVSHVRLLVPVEKFLSGPKGVHSGGPKEHHSIVPIGATLITESFTESLTVVVAAGDAKAMKAEDILKQKSSSPISLEGLWKSRCSLSGEFQKPLTNKERGQLSQLKKALGQDVTKVVTYALDDWVKFAQKAGAESGQVFPTKPHIGFLLKHYPVVVNMMSAKDEQVQKLQSIAQPSVEIAVVTELPHSVTSDELAEMLAGLKE